mmetsp:Transcript_33497/g.69204  ORF Transcript_33497/g.69204 Transcript_33497/m.69204 type:complete len:237 (+) Transcript_33497:230-940(+)
MTRCTFVTVLLPLCFSLVSTAGLQSGFVHSVGLKHNPFGIMEKRSFLANRHAPAAAPPPSSSSHGKHATLPAMDSSSAVNMDNRAVAPAQILERLRRERQENSGVLQKFVERIAPQDDMEKLKLNWVGNIDRHQRKLFWMLISMLCDKIAPILRVCRAVHDFILLMQAKAHQYSVDARHKWIPAMVQASRLAMVRSARCAKVAAKDMVVAGFAAYKVYPRACQNSSPPVLVYRLRC